VGVGVAAQVVTALRCLNSKMPGLITAVPAHKLNVFGKPFEGGCLFFGDTMVAQHAQRCPGSQQSVRRPPLQRFPLGGESLCRVRRRTDPNSSQPPSYTLCALCAQVEVQLPGKESFPLRLAKSITTFSLKLVEEGSSSGNWKVTLGIEKSKALEHGGKLLSISCLLHAAAADRLRAHTIPNIPATVPIFDGEDQTAASSNLSSGNGLLPTKRKALVA
jgi:hypothetical protein